MGIEIYTIHKKESPYVQNPSSAQWVVIASQGQAVGPGIKGGR